MSSLRLPPRIELIIVSAVTVISALLFREGHNFFILNNARKRPGATGRIRLLLNRDGVRTWCAYSETFVPWTNIRDIAATDTTIHLFLQPTQAFIVPKRAFSGQDHAQQFIETARAYSRAARSGTDSPPPETLAMADATLIKPNSKYVENGEACYVAVESERPRIHQRRETEITIEVVPLDHVDFCRFVAKKHPRSQLPFLPFYLAGPIFLSWVTFELQLAPSVCVIAVSILSVMWIVFVREAHKSTVLQNAQKRPGATGQIRLLLNSDGVREWSSYSEMFVPWIHIQYITESDSAIQIFVQPLHAFILPKRAFSGQDHAQHFIETARAYWNAARDGTEPILPEPLAMWPPPPRSS